MPTANPRIAITLLPHRHDLLKRMAALQGVSMASVVSELLEEFYPVLERVCVAMERAKDAQESSKAGIRESAIKAFEEIAPLTVAANNQLDLLFAEMDAHLRTGEEGAARTDATAADARTRPPGVAPDSVSAKSINPRVVTRGSGKKNGNPSNAVKPMRSKASKGGL